VERNADKVSGASVFRGTRVPVSALFSNVEGASQLTSFWNGFPAYPAKM
jgi:uncharacterized protein (DUF433 family)